MKSVMFRIHKKSVHFSWAMILWFYPFIVFFFFFFFCLVVTFAHLSLSHLFLIKQIISFHLFLSSFLAQLTAHRMYIYPSLYIYFCEWKLHGSWSPPPGKPGKWECIFQSGKSHGILSQFIFSLRYFNCTNFVNRFLYLLSLLNKKNMLNTGKVKENFKLKKWEPWSQHLQCIVHMTGSLKL